MSCQGWAPLGVGFCSRAQEEKFPSREMPSYDLQQATTGAKGEVTVIGKCGFVGFAELRVSVLRNVYFAGRRLQRLPCPSAGVAPLGAAGFSCWLLEPQRCRRKPAGPFAVLQRLPCILPQSISALPQAFHRHTERGRIYPANKHVRSDCLH